MNGYLLSARGLSCSFGALHVIVDMSFDIAEGEVVGIIGPNGAGKTTLMSLLSGSQPASRGEIDFRGQSITRRAVHERARAGIARTFQIPRPFGHMTVEQNLLVSAHFAGGGDVAARVEDALDLCGLGPFRNHLAGGLPLLMRKRHELARALAGGPRLLLVDEVAGGLTDREVDEFIDLIRALKGRGLTIIWIEHIMRAMLTATDRLVAIDRGSIIADGTSAQVIDNPAVRQIYLGKDH